MTSFVSFCRSVFVCVCFFSHIRLLLTHGAPLWLPVWNNCVRRPVCKVSSTFASQSLPVPLPLPVPHTVTFVLILADVDECVTSTHSCLPSEHCVNTVGSFVCELWVPCPAGYQLRNSVCEGEFIVPDVFHYGNLPSSHFQDNLSSQWKR